MAKKIAAVLACAVILISLIPFTASAADSASFKICTVSQDSKSITVTLDFVKGKGFCSFNAGIEYNNLKLSLEECQFASGFAAFKSYADKQDCGAMIFNANMNANPVRVAIASVVPFKMINKDGSILKLKFSKIEGSNISESDLVLTIDNCQNEDFKDMKTSVSYDLTSGSSSSVSDATVEAGLTPEENAKQTSQVPGQSEAAADTSGNQAAQGAENTQKSQSGETADASSVGEASSSPSARGSVGISNSKKTVVIIIITVLCLGGIGYFTYVFKKNEKASADSGKKGKSENKSGKKPIKKTENKAGNKAGNKSAKKPENKSGK